MKAKLTQENKAKFFALYYDQCVLLQASFVKGYDISHIKGGLEETVYGEKLFLTLKPLSQISDEDAIEVGFMSASHFVKCLECYGAEFDTLLLKHHHIDFLRSRGYALPWMGLSVEELIEAGWIRLTES